MKYWIFKVNPDIYRIDDRFKDPNPNITWSVTRFRDQIKIDDIAYIWRTGNPRGICGTLYITSNPTVMYEPEIENRYAIKPDYQAGLKVMAIITAYFPIIESETLKIIPGLEGLSVFHGFQQATNFPVTFEESKILMRVIDYTEKNKNIVSIHPPRNDRFRPLSGVNAFLKPPPKRKPPRQAGVREEDARLANDPPPPIINANSLSGEDLEV
jgi:hypothetical protein